LGKADAFLISTQRSAVLIDAGSREQGKQLAQALEQLGITTLDYLILTHFDGDHIGGVAYLVKSVHIAQVLQSPIPANHRESRQCHAILKKAGLAVDDVRTVEQFLLDGVTYTIFPPQKRHYRQDQRNNASLLVHLRHGGNTFLFMADAQEARIQELLSLRPGRCDFLKIPHHGRWQKSLLPLLAATAPHYSVITSSDSKKEAPETVTALKKAGCQSFLTRKGTVVCFSDGIKLTFFQ
jgi:beta-lactamase superfamily II metal-dependent hydrolase